MKDELRYIAGLLSAVIGLAVAAGLFIGVTFAVGMSVINLFPLDH